MNPALNALFAGDIAPMEDVWSHGPDVMAMHPLGGRQLGWEEVKESWEQIDVHHHTDIDPEPRAAMERRKAA